VAGIAEHAVSERMWPQPSLSTARLILRPFAISDGAAVQRLAGAAAVADGTLNVPHPYPDGAAEAWIATHAAGWGAGTLVAYAIALEAGELVGAASLQVVAAHRRAELGYWVGVPHWGRGYATEAARAMVAFAFDTLHLHRVQALHLTRNPASGRVLQKVGMIFEGVHRGYYVKGGRPEDVARYAALAPEWSATHSTIGGAA
jgi:[ribosomal protein S5]-alanine N-acetyltransferase